MTQTVKTYDGLPFFIGTGQRISENKFAGVQSALYARLRNTQEWLTRYKKGVEVRKAKDDKEQGAIKNVNITYAYNAYFKFLHQSLLSLKDTFRVISTDYTVDKERPREILRTYLESLQSQNDLLIDDAILYGCASIVMDVNLNTENGLPDILVNRVKSAKIIYDYEQPGSGVYTIRITPEIAYKFDFLSDYNRLDLFNYAIADAERVSEIRVFTGELVVDGKLDNYVIIIFRRRVIYAEKGRDLTILHSVSINDKNNDCSPIYPVLKATELTKDVYKLVFDYNDKVVNPIRAGNWSFDSTVWETAKQTGYLELPATFVGQLQTLLPGELDIGGLVGIQQNTQILSQQATGLNEYTLGESGGSVRTFGEAMMLADSASGILNILSNKLKQQLILPILQDILEILKVTTQNQTDLFHDSLSVDTDIAKDQQEVNMLLSLINMPMFGAVIQGLQPMQAIMLFRWILEKLHITGTQSVFDSIIDNTLNNTSNKGV
jgi:hypothetical protein